MTTRLSQPVLALACLALAGAAQAASPAVPDSLRACMNETDVLRRLSCYDSEMSRATSQAAPLPGAAAPAAAPARAVVAAPAAAAAAAAPVAAEPARGGMTGFLRKLVPSKGKNPATVDTDRSQVARITAVRQAANGLAVITLDNGQVWRQTETEAYFPLDVGNTIRIETGALGSYRLTRVEEGWKRFMRVSLVSIGTPTAAPAQAAPAQAAAPAAAPTAPAAAQSAVVRAPAPIPPPSPPPARAAAAAPAPAPVAAAAPAAVAPVAAAPAATGGGITGFASGLMQKLKPGSGGRSVASPENIQTARIAALQTTGAGLAVITLDNGQVWRQQETMAYFPLAIGDTIRIESGALGSYRLTRIEEGWKTFMRVSRTK